MSEADQIRHDELLKVLKEIRDVLKELVPPKWTGGPR